MQDPYDSGGVHVVILQCFMLQRIKSCIHFYIIFKGSLKGLNKLTVFVTFMKLKCQCQCPCCYTSQFDPSADLDIVLGIILCVTNYKSPFPQAMFFYCGLTHANKWYFSGMLLSSLIKYNLTSI
jgi:hypothetical protein